MQIDEIDKFNDGIGCFDGFKGDNSKRFIKTAIDVKRNFPDVRLSTMFFFLGEKREILAAQHISEIDFDFLDAEAVFAKAEYHGSNEIYITHFPEDLEEGDAVIEGTTVQYQKSLGNMHDVIGFCSFAKELKNKNLTTLDVAVQTDFWGMDYSETISYELFPGLYEGMHKYAFDLANLSYELKTPEDTVHLFDYLRAKANKNNRGLPKAHAVFVSRYNWCSCFTVSVNNSTQIPGILEGCKLIPENAIKAVKLRRDDRQDYEGSIMMVVDKQENDLSPNEDEIAFAQEARRLTQKYGVSLKEVILLGKYDSALRQYDTLVI